MDDKSKAIQALKLGVAICDTALASLAGQVALSTSLVSGMPDLPVLHKDFLSLLNFLHNSATKLSIALKPSSPTYAAAMTPLKDISARVNALIHCAGLFRVYGSTISQEVATIATNVISAMRGLLQTFLNPEEQERYLVKTGAVHNLIDNAKSTNGLSASNLEAVRKVFAQNQSTLDDGLAELQEMTDDARSGSEEEEDGWDELGLGPGPKLSPTEVERIKKVHMVLRLSSLFHKRIRIDLLSGEHQWTSTALDDLSSLSAKLLASTDELVSTVYGQRVDEIQTEFTAFKDVLDRLRTAVSAAFQQTSLDKAMSQASINDKPQKGSKQWFDTCFQQIDKSSQALVAALESNTVT